jgi:hypothetical protein
LIIQNPKWYNAHYAKIGESQWLLREYRGSEGEINLESVGIALVIREIYEEVNFELTEE